MNTEKITEDHNKEVIVGLNHILRCKWQREGMFQLCRTENDQICAFFLQWQYTWYSHCYVAFIFWNWS